MRNISKDLNDTTIHKSRGCQEMQYVDKIILTSQSYKIKWKVD